MSGEVHSGAARWRSERRPSETDGLLVEAHRHLERGHRDRARRVAKETLLTEMSLPEGLEVGRLLHLLDETQAAVDLFHTLLRQARSSVDQATVRAALLMVLGRYDEAVEPLRFLVDHQPGDAEAHLRLAQCFLRSGRSEPALAAVQRARQVAPDWPDMHLEFGRIALRLGAIEDARVALYRAWRIDPDDRRNTLAIAALWMRARKPAEALPLYEHALEIHGDAAQVLVEAGLAFARSERVEDARRCLSRLEERHPRRKDVARRLAAAIDEAVALEDSVVELDDDDLVSVDGSLPAGFESLVPVAGKERRLGDVTTGEVEAALGTLDLDISMDELGSYESYDETPIPPPLDPDGVEPIPPPPVAETRPAGRASAPPTAASHAPPASAASAASAEADAPDAAAASEARRPITRAPLTDVDQDADTFERTPLLPPPAAVPRPPLEPGDSVERAIDRMVLDGGLPELPRPVTLRAGDPEAEGDTGQAGAEAPAGALLGPPPAGRPEAADDPPLLQADIPVGLEASADGHPSQDPASPDAAAQSAPDDSFDGDPETPPPAEPARARPSAFALLGPPPEKRRQTGPLPLGDALPPLMAFGSLSGDLSVPNLDEPDMPFDSGRPAPPRRRTRRSTGSLPLLAPRPSSAPPGQPPEPVARPGRAPGAGGQRSGDSTGHSASGSVGHSASGSMSSMGSSGGQLVDGGRRRSRAPTGGHRRFDTPRGSGPTGPLPSLPQRQTFAEMTVGGGLAHHGGPGVGQEATGRSRRGDRVRPRTSPGGPMPPPQAGAWGAAPRTDPLLTTSDALQRWRPPSAPPERPEPPSRPPEAREPAPGARLGGRASPSLRSQTALIAGSQAVFWAPRILRFMEGGHLSGAVGLNAPQGQAEVQFRAGRLTGASASNRATLSQVLQQPQRLSPAQRSALGDLTWTAQDGESLLDRLVETGLFEAPNVNATVIDQVFATVSEVLRWGVGWFTLVAHADPPSRAGGRTVKLPLAALLSGVEDDREGAAAAAGLREAADAVRLDPRLETRIRAQRQRVEREPDDDRARLQLGQLLMRAEHYVQAIDVFMTGLSGSVDPRYVKLIGLAIEGLAQHGPRRGSGRLLQIVLCGRLGRVGLVQLLELLGPERITGTVRLIASEGLAEIELADGELAGATNSNTARLGDLMRASSIMTSDQIEALVARQYARERWQPLGRLAVEADLLEPDQMRGLLQKQVRLALLEAGRWRQAHFVVELGQHSGLKLHRDLDTAGILRDLRRMVGRGR